MLTGFISDMGGLCLNNALPPDCYPGAKWTPNDPVFFLHHGVRSSHLSAGFVFAERWLTPLVLRRWSTSYGMIGKIGSQ